MLKLRLQNISRDISFLSIVSKEKLYWLTPKDSRFYVTFYYFAESMTFDPTKPTDVESMTSGDYTVWRTGKQNEVRFGMICSCYEIL